MRRREFIAFIGAVSILPRAARSQQSTKVYRIALLHPSHPVSELAEHSRFRYWREFFQELRQLGYVEGHNLVIERFSAEGRVEIYPKLARDASVGNPDLVFAISDQLVAALKSNIDNPDCCHDQRSDQQRHCGEYCTAGWKHHRRHRRCRSGALGKTPSAFQGTCSNHIETRNFGCTNKP